LFVFLPDLQQIGSTANINVAIARNGVNAQATLFRSIPAAQGIAPHLMYVYDATVAGPVTMKVTFNTSAGTMTSTCGTGKQGTLLVRDTGPQS
jgi:hypothetical protein